MNTLEQILQANQHFTSKIFSENNGSYPEVTKLPSRSLAVFSCMDTRLVDFLEPALGIRRGEAKIIKNAGNSLIGSFDSVIGSFILCVFELGVKEILVIGHLDCGVANAKTDVLMQKMLKRGIPLDAIKAVEKNMAEWIDNFIDPVDNVKKVVAKIRSNPLIPYDIPVHGLLLNPFTGELSVIVDGYKSS